MLFKNTNYRNKARGLTDPVMLLEIELSDSVVQVERVYPNLIDLCSDIGSILKVVLFFCIATGMVHNRILIKQGILNSIFSSEVVDNSLKAGSQLCYSYWDILTL